MVSLFQCPKFLYTVFPHIVSALEQFPPLNSFRTCMYCYQRSQYIRLNSKKNSFRGNYSRKYGKFFGQNFLNIIFGHFMETAWIVGPLRQANMIFSWILLRHRLFFHFFAHFGMISLLIWLEHKAKNCQFLKKKQVTKNSILIKYQKNQTVQGNFF